MFFRSRTLGYDVYPEDHFLKNFPWQQYGGLWIVDESRFARSTSLNPLTAQALRRTYHVVVCETVRDRPLLSGTETLLDSFC